MEEVIKKILIVEDDVDIGRLYMKTLEERDYAVFDEIFIDGDEAIRFIDNNDDYINLIILDFCIFNTQGIDVIKYLWSKEKTKKIPILIISVISSSDAKKDLNGFKNVCGHICKPCQMSELLEKVHTITVR